MKNAVKNQLGVTMVEILIATMISVIVLAAVMELFGSNYKSYILQNDVANMQENLRVGMTFLDRDVTMIGSGMIGVNKPGGFNIMKILDGKLIRNPAYPLTFQNNAGDIAGLTADPVTNLFPTNGKGGSDRLVIRYNRLEEGDCGLPPAGVTNQWACDNLPQITVVEKMPPNSPEAKIKEALKYGTGPKGWPCEDPNLPCYSPYPKWEYGCYCGDHLYDNQGKDNYGFFALITASDNSKADIFVVTQIQGKADSDPPGASNKLQNARTMGLDNTIVNEYPSDSKISFFTMKTFKEVMYYVQDRQLRQRITKYPDPGDTLLSPPQLNPISQDQPLVENIDDLQFAFGLDTDGDGTIDKWVGLNNDTLTDAESIQVRLVRINLLGRTARPNSTIDIKMDNVIRTATGTSSDKLEDHLNTDIESEDKDSEQKGRYFMRKLIQTTVKVRSLGLN